MGDSKQKELLEYTAIKYLKPSNAVFTRTAGGFLSLRTGDGEEHARVNLHRAFPFSEAYEYISVRDTEGKEIGIIRSLNDFPKEVVKLLEEDMNRRYFAPVITKINSLKEEFGYSYWDVQTDAGPCRFTVRNGSSSFINITEVRIMVVDVDGNRFEITYYRELDEKSIKKLEILL
jgi:hypothetical protein